MESGPRPNPMPPAAEISDAQLVSQALAGQKLAFDQLIQRHQRQAVAVSYRLLGNMNDALELTQDAYLKAFSSLASLQKPEAFAGWLMRIVSNLSLNYRRSRKSKSALPLDDILGPGNSSGREGGSSEWMARDDDPVKGLQSREMGERLKKALGELPEKQRQALLMFTMDELPQKEIAAALDCSVEAVKWHVFQGRKRLKEILKEHLQD